MTSRWWSITPKTNIVYDIDGRQFLDFFGGILTVSVGHCNDKVTRAIDEQTHKVQHMSTLYANEPQVRLAEKLAQITPGRLEKSFFTNSGTEANETAVLLAQLYTKCQDVITLRHSYSGRSYLALSFSAQSSWRLMPNVVPGVHHIANAYCYRCPFGLTYPSCDLKCATDAEEAIQTMTSQGRVAAFLAEPIQGVGGFIVPPKEYFKEIVGIIRKYGGLFISDEVQTGLGSYRRQDVRHRTLGRRSRHHDIRQGHGQWRADWRDHRHARGCRQHEGQHDLHLRREPGDVHGGARDHRSHRRRKSRRKRAPHGQRLRDGLNALKDKYPIIGDVRGMGLMQGMELVGEKKKPDVENTKRVMELTKNNGLLIGKGGTYGNVLRVAPPLNVNKEQIDQALTALDRSFGQVGSVNH